MSESRTLGSGPAAGPEVSRRGFLLAGTSAAAVLALSSGEARAEVAGGPGPRDSGAPAALGWLGNAAPEVARLVSFGVPWPQGAIAPGTELALGNAAGESLPLQSWTLATWPDGSLKWSGHAVSGQNFGDGLHIAPGQPAPHALPVSVRETATEITLSTGNFRVLCPKSGESLISEARLGDRVIVSGLRLRAMAQDTPDPRASATISTYVSRISDAVVEQDGPLRAVVRIEGMHHGRQEGAERDWLPFTVRIALGAGTDGLDITHTFIFDGDKDRDFICGLGMVADVPLTGEMQNRHVRLAGEGEGVWAEAVRNLPGWATRKNRYGALFPNQLRGERVLSVEAMDARDRKEFLELAAFDDYRLSQLSADGFEVTKRTDAEGSWLKAGWGGRSDGAGYVGTPDGGLIFGMRDFWQRCPSGLAIRGARGDVARAEMWFWSPESEPMDLRHYSTRAHGLRLAYEDITEGYSTPYGIAHSNRLRLVCVEATPTPADFARHARSISDPPLLTCAPERYRDSFALGVLSLPDHGTRLKEAVEAQGTGLVEWYMAEVDRQHWYGFWDYGDIRHKYDMDRHQWLYDTGGYAWDNSELASDVWLWTHFLRTGRKDIFRMAEAMTHHTGEVDVYHLGEMKGLGSRHNVSHWGGGAKEVRISQALYRRYLYYLTADERIGDQIAEVYDADQALLRINPLRKVLPPPPDAPTYARSGPDWLAFAGNWMIAWERTGDPKWRDKILTGMRSIVAAPNGMLSGPNFEFDPATGVLTPYGEDWVSSYHLVTIMGGGEVMFELDRLIDYPEWSATWLTFCKVYNATPAERQRLLGVNIEKDVFLYPQWHARLTAFAAWKTGDPALAARAWDILLGGGDAHDDQGLPMRVAEVAPPQALEPRSELGLISTNHAAQWSLNMFEVMAFVPDATPTAMEARWRDWVRSYVPPMAG